MSTKMDTFYLYASENEAIQWSNHNFHIHTEISNSNGGMKQAKRDENADRYEHHSLFICHIKYGWQNPFVQHSER